MLEGFVIYLILGAFVGVIAGLLGVGGGLIMVPVLIMLFQHYDFSSEIITHLAVGTSLATIMLTSISSVRAHHIHGAVLWPVFNKLTPGIILGTLAGSWLASLISSDALKIFFGIFELTVALQMALELRPNASRRLPAWPGMNLAGGLIGAVSAMVGIGGGTMTVPFLVWCNIRIQQAVATSSACGLPIAIAGSVGFMITGWQNPQLPAGSTGFIFWPAFLGIILTSIVTAPLGARLAHRLPAGTLKKVFAIFLAILGIRMLLG
ncbi:MAG: sulfite exporter TauE/SafE family protein [Gammaproteobacteria bacterium]|nr:sulfite exporter TauE/SafE family protein [Gammaproteobacteria bacterium]